MSTVTLEEKHLDELKKGVKALADHVQDMKRGLIDEETVRRIAADVLATQKIVDRDVNGRKKSFNDDDDDYLREGVERRGGIQALGATVEERVHAIQTLPASVVGPILHRDREEIVLFQQASDAVAILDAIITARKGSPEADHLPASVQDTVFYRQRYQPLMQAISASGAGAGAEFVPRELSANLVERVALELRVAALFPLIDMPTNPFDVPGRPVARTRTSKATENTADTGQTPFVKLTPASRKVTLTAAKFAGEALTSKEAEEDAIIAIMPFLTSELVDYLAADLEDATINGDTAGTMDTGWATADPRKNFDGIRKFVQAGFKTDVGNVAPTVALTARANRKKMLKYGVSPDKLAHICSLSAYLQLLADVNVQTMEKYGPHATILAGELGRMDGAPIIVSEYVRQDLNASGVFDNVTTNRTEVITVNTGGWLRGSRRGLTVQILRELYAEDDQDAIIATLRQALVPRYPNTEGIAAIAYDVAS